MTRKVTVEVGATVDPDPDPDPDQDVGPVAEELYGLTPAQFVAARNERAASARRDGQRDLAAAVTRLRRPSPSAWVVNLLVRDRPDEVAQLLELGAQLRAAQASLSADDMRALGRQRRRVITDLARRGRALAAERGVGVSDAAGREVEASLEAALADPGAAEAVRTGQLVRALQPGGFGGIDLAVDRPRPQLSVVGETGGSQAAESAADDPVGAHAELRRQAALQQAQVEWDAATEAAGRAEEAVAAASARQAEALRRTEEAATVVGRLERQLDDARTGATAAAHEADRARAALQRARSDAEAATRRAEAAHAALDASPTASPSP